MRLPKAVVIAKVVSQVLSHQNLGKKLSLGDATDWGPSLDQNENVDNDLPKKFKPSYQMHVHQYYHKPSLFTLFLCLPLLTSPRHQQKWQHILGKDRVETKQEVSQEENCHTTQCQDECTILSRGVTKILIAQCFLNNETHSGHNSGSTDSGVVWDPNFKKCHHTCNFTIS